jgi:hypothetical protein
MIVEDRCFLAGPVSGERRGDGRAGDGEQAARDE